MDTKEEGEERNDQGDTNQGERENQGEIKPGLDKAIQPNGRHLAFHISGSIEFGWFKSVNDVYIKFNIVTGPDWILSAGSDVGITQIARYSKTSRDNHRNFVWNQPISVSYRSYNYYGWPQIVLSAYHFDSFGNDRILGYGVTHLPVTSSTTTKQEVEIYSPQSSSFAKQLLIWLTGRKPELVDSTLFARPDCRQVLQVVRVGHVDVQFHLTSRGVAENGYKSLN